MKGTRRWLRFTTTISPCAARKPAVLDQRVVVGLLDEDERRRKPEKPGTNPIFGFRVQGSGFRVQGSGFRVQGSGFRV